MARVKTRNNSARRWPANPLHVVVWAGGWSDGGPGADPAPSGLGSRAAGELDVATPVAPDSREGSANMEELLERVLEENRLLKMRLEQMGSGYGWYGATPVMADVAQHSPMSFAPEEVRGPGVQSSRARTAIEGLSGASGVASGLNFDFGAVM